MIGTCIPSSFNTEAPIDSEYFVRQVAGLTQITGDLMRVDPRVIDLGWGRMKTAIVTMKDTAFVSAADAAAHRQALLAQYLEAFRLVEKGDPGKGAEMLRALSASGSTRLTPDARAELNTLVDAQRGQVG